MNIVHITPESQELLSKYGKENKSSLSLFDFTVRIISSVSLLNMIAYVLRISRQKKTE